MFALKNVIGNVKISRDLILLLSIGALYSLSVSLSNTFVNVYLWKQSGEYLQLGIYNLSVVVMQPITFFLAGRWAKKMDRVIVLRLGVAFLAIFFISVLMFGQNASQFLVLLGAVLGTGYGFYWLAFNVLTFEITDPGNRDFFNGFLGIVGSLTGMIGPVAAGFVISNFKKFTGYTIIFTVSLALFFCAVILSFFIKRRKAEGTYQPGAIFRERKRNPNWRGITNAHFFQGVREGTFIFVISVLVFVTTGSEMALGKYGLVNSGVSFIAYYLATRLIKKEYRKKSILIGGLMLYAAVFLIAFEVTYFRLILYAITIAIAYPILLVPYVSLTYDVIGRGWKAGEMRIEYIVIRELFLNLGRILSILLFIVSVTLFNESASIPYLFVLVGLGHTLIYFCIRKIDLPDEETEDKPTKTPIPITKRKLIDNEGGSTV